MLFGVCATRVISADEAASLPPAKLIMVVGVKGAISEKLLQDIMIQGLEKSSCTCQDNRPEVNVVSPTFYREFRKIVNLTEGDTEQPSSNSGVSIASVFAPSEDYPYLYDLTLDAPGLRLSRLALTYDSGEEEEIGGSDNDRIKKIGIDEQNRNIYRVKLKNPPASFAATVGNLQEEDRQIKGVWPDIETHYAVTFVNFRGDYGEFEQVLKNEKPGVRIADPLKDIEEFSDTRFLLAMLDRDIRKGRESKPDMLLTIEVPEAEDSTIKDVWVKLPLTSEQLSESLAEFSSDETGLAVIKRMRMQRKHPQPLKFGMNPDSNPPLTAGSEPAWYPLTKVPDAPIYRGELFLGDPNIRRELFESFPQMHMLVIQEDDTARAIELEYEDDGNVLRSRVVPQLISDADLSSAANPAGKE